MLAASAVGTSSYRAATTASAGVVRLAPSGIAVEPDIVDPRCNGGRGVRLLAELAGDPVLAGGTMADGSALIALSEVYPGKRYAVLTAVTPGCAPNRAFGEAGVAKIAVPAHLRAKRAGAGGIPPDGVWITTIAARSGGGAILGGTFGGYWVVAAITAGGKVDPSFGTAGWTLLPFRGEVSAVVQEPSGRIVIGGDNGGGGCCTLNWAGALSPRGRLEPTFGRHGRVPLPTGADSGVAGLALEPNGDILAKVAYGNMGCWGVAFAMLTPSGRPVPLFEQRLDRFWNRFGFGAFVGDAYVDGAGFSLVGTGQRPCVHNPSLPTHSAAGLVARFRTDGRGAAPVRRFPSQLDAEVSAFKHGADTLLAESNLQDPTLLTLAALRPDGSVDTGFGTNGRVRIRAPAGGRTTDTMLSIAAADATSIVVVARRDGSRQLRIVRLRF